MHDSYRPWRKENGNVIRDSAMARPQHEGKNVRAIDKETLGATTSASMPAPTAQWQATGISINHRRPVDTPTLRSTFLTLFFETLSESTGNVTSSDIFSEQLARSRPGSITKHTRARHQYCAYTDTPRRVSSVNVTNDCPLIGNTTKVFALPRHQWQTVSTDVAPSVQHYGRPPKQCRSTVCNLWLRHFE